MPIGRSEDANPWRIRRSSAADPNMTRTPRSSRGEGATRPSMTAAKQTKRDSDGRDIPQPVTARTRARREAEPEGRGGTGAGEPPRVALLGNLEPLVYLMGVDLPTSRAIDLGGSRDRTPA